MTDEADYTEDEAGAAATDGVNALFAAHRTVTAGERSAYIIGPAIPSDDDDPEVGPGNQVYVYALFRNGRLDDGGANPQPIFTMRQAVADTVAAVATAYPDHAQQQVIWRLEPVVEHWTPEEPPAQPNTWTGKCLRMRLVATPLGV